MIPEEDLRIAAREYEMRMLERLPAPEACRAAFSRKFERRMKRLIFRTDHPVRWRIQRSAACFLLAVLLGCGGLLLFSSRAQAAFFGWVREFYETHFVYHYTGETPDTPDAPEQTAYRPAWVPDGYEILSEFHGFISSNIVYQNPEGNTISYGYTFDNESTVYGITVEDATVEHLMIRDCPADLYTERDAAAASSLVWTDEEIGAIFYVLSPLSREELIQIAESVQEQKFE